MVQNLKSMSVTLELRYKTARISLNTKANANQQQFGNKQTTEISTCALSMFTSPFCVRQFYDSEWVWLRSAASLDSSKHLDPVSSPLSVRSVLLFFHVLPSSTVEVLFVACSFLVIPPEGKGCCLQPVYMFVS